MFKIFVHSACCGTFLFLSSTATFAVTYLEQIDRLASINAALLDYRPVALPGPRPEGMIELSLEVDPIPRVDNTIGTESKSVTTPPVAAKLRANWSPISGLRLGVYLIPPITVFGIKANMSGVEVDYGWRQKDFVGSFRMFYTQGWVTGPFTDPDVVDRFKVSGAGADLRLGWVDKAWTWFGGIGVGGKQTQFQLAQDGAVIDGQHTYRYGFVGVGWTHENWTLLAEQHRTESYLNHVLFGVSYGF